MLFLLISIETQINNLDNQIFLIKEYYYHLFICYGA